MAKATSNDRDEDRATPPKSAVKPTVDDSYDRQKLAADQQEQADKEAAQAPERQEADMGKFDSVIDGVRKDKKGRAASAFEYPIVNEILGKIRSNYQTQGDIVTAISNVQRSEPQWPVELEPICEALIGGWDPRSEGKGGQVHLGEPRPGEVKAGMAQKGDDSRYGANYGQGQREDGANQQGALPGEDEDGDGFADTHPEDTSYPNPSTGMGQPKATGIGAPGAPKTVIKK